MNDNLDYFKRVSLVLVSEEARQILMNFALLIGVQETDVADVLELLLERREKNGNRVVYVFSPYNRFSTGERILHAMCYYTQPEANKFQQFFIKHKRGGLVDGYIRRPYLWFEW